MKVILRSRLHDFPHKARQMRPCTTERMFSVRKRSGSDKQKGFLCESEASATKRVARSGNQPLRINLNV
ncbi:hypothetical protein [Lysinibacillus sp. G4S2]|uniref:hypothetical protein n=1 Tax=Lysinibacillus sp. G4S2 TaxID=3055859 RepID=UPI0025A13CA8|nr:hypothetical protein [Lysinibacillus sp. G4S2]MDM5250644.1 hypothetical protein [Lysinibacillus sp. G4S2]